MTVLGAQRALYGDSCRPNGFLNCGIIDSRAFPIFEGPKTVFNASHFLKGFDSSLKFLKFFGGKGLAFISKLCQFGSGGDHLILGGFARRSY